MTAETVTAISSAVVAVATVSLVVAAVLALAQIQEAKRSRHATTATDFSRRWDAPDMIETRALLEPYKDPAAFKTVYFELLDKPNDNEANLKALRMLKEANFLEDLAILYNSQAVDDDFIIGSLGYILVSRWDWRWKDVADEYRSRSGRDNYPAWRDLVDRIRDHPKLA